MKIGLIGIVSEEMKADFWGTLSQLSKMGYEGIEGVEARLSEGDVTENMRRFEGLGLTHLTATASFEDLRGGLEDIRKVALATHTDRVTLWWSEAKDRDTILRDAELFESAAVTLAESGIRFCYHNHDQEFRNTFDGVSAWSLLTENTSKLCFVVDVGWVEVGGASPAQVLRDLGPRVVALHIKDFADVGDRNSFTTVGTGAVDFPTALAVGQETGVGWAVVEQDKLRNLNAMEAVQASCLNLREMGLPT